MRRIAAIAAVSLAAAGTASAASLPGFHSPSGNIRCLLIQPKAMICDVASASYSTALQARCMGPSGGGVDWHGFFLSASKPGQVNCSGGILYDPGTHTPHYVDLPYGKTWKRGPFSCASATNGVVCRSRTGHGVAVSRRAWRVW